MTLQYSSNASFSILQFFGTSTCSILVSVNAYSQIHFNDDGHGLQKSFFLRSKIWKKNEKKFLCFSDIKNTYIKRTIRVT